MPNWCFTQLTVSGPPEDINRFAEGLERNKDKDGNYSILSTYLPTPEELLSTVAGFITDEEKQEALRIQQAANTAKYGHADWYGWRIENYGSKWADSFGEYDRDSLPNYDHLGFHIDTAWSPITEGIRAVSALFPTLVFQMSYEEEAGFFVGAEVHKAGETLFLEQEEPPCPEQGEDEDDDAWYDKISELRSDLRWQIDERADAVSGPLLNGVEV